MGKQYTLETEHLDFDRKNPRLVQLDGLADASDLDIVRALVKEADLSELVSSIISNKYINIEPLVISGKETQKAGRFRVLEGNRRLAAIRLIQNPDFARSCQFSLPDDIPQNVLESIVEVSVFEVDEDREARAFIGFKHINGAHRWNSYAKAKYLTNWYASEDIKIEEIATQLGDQNQTVRNLIGGMLVLQQAEEKELFNIANRKKLGPFGFSHLYTALGRIEYRDFFGLKKDWNSCPIIHPVPEDKEDRLKEVLTYIYGSRLDEIDSVIHSQNPDLKRLGQVISKPLALQVLRTSLNLEQAFEEVMPASSVFSDKLVIASQRVQDALSSISKFDANEADILYPIAKSMLDNSESVVAIMDKKIKTYKEE